MSTKNEAEAQIIVAVLQASDGRCDHAYLEGHLKHIPSQEFRELVKALTARGAIRLSNAEGGVVEAPNASERLERADALAAVVLHVLVTEELTEFEQIAESVERDTSKPEERAEVDLALRLLELYELAAHAASGHWRATLAARKATDLSF